MSPPCQRSADSGVPFPLVFAVAELLGTMEETFEQTGFAARLDGGAKPIREENGQQQPEMSSRDHGWLLSLNAHSHRYHSWRKGYEHFRHGPCNHKGAVASR